MPFAVSEVGLHGSAPAGEKANRTRAIGTQAPGADLGRASPAAPRRVSTAPDYPRPRLRGRTYAIPFDDVWTAAMALVADLRGWSAVRADDEAGAIDISRRYFLGGRKQKIRVRIRLDACGQTRVDIRVEARKVFFGRSYLGRSTVNRFLRRLDLAVEALPGLILIPAPEAGRVVRPLEK